MNDHKICFIMCSNDEFLAQEALRYIYRLTIPDGYEIEHLVVQDAVSMTSGYNAAMKESDAKYKVYVHQDVLIINPDFIVNMLELFQNNKTVGMFGMVGNSKISMDGRVFSGEDCKRIGQVFIDMIYEKSYSAFSEIKDSYQEAVVLDGLLMATQYDLPWREDLFGGWDFYDCSQSMEFWKAGYQVVVPPMETPWCLHDNDILNMSQYDKWRNVFVEEYKDIMQKIMCRIGR